MASGKKSGGMRKFGRNKIKCQRYRDQRRREKHKLKRVLKSSGVAAAEAYARAHKLTFRMAG